MRDAGVAPEVSGAQSGADEAARLWLHAWLCSAMGAVTGTVLLVLATWLLWRWRGWQPGAGGTAAEIGLFLRMVGGGLFGAFLGGLLAARGPQELCLTAGAGGCLTYILGMQVVVMVLYAIRPEICRDEGLPGVGRVEFLLVAGSVGALLPPLVTALVLSLRRPAADGAARGGVP